MPLLKSLSNCGRCQQPEIYDTNTKIITCQCGKFYASFINFQNFRELLQPGQKTLLDLTDIEGPLLGEKK